jgi:hypothetical protein
MAPGWTYNISAESDEAVILCIASTMAPPQPLFPSLIMIGLASSD